MFKLIGAVLVTLSGWGAGFYLSLRKNHNIEDVRSIIRYLDSMAAELSLTRAPLCDIAQELADRHEFRYLEFARMCAQSGGMSRSFAEIFLQATKHLKPWARHEVAPCLAGLSDQLGNTPLDTQLAAIENCKNGLGIILEDMISKKKKCAGLYNSVGALGGAALVILMW